eukprot:2264278-Amphidinium_carterae.1
MQGDSEGPPSEELVARTWLGLCPGNYTPNFACASAAVPAALHLPSISLQSEWSSPYCCSAVYSTDALCPTMEAEQLLHASQHLECAQSVQMGSLVEIDTSSLSSAISISSSAVEVSAMGKRDRSVVLTPATNELSAASRSDAASAHRGGMMIHPSAVGLLWTVSRGAGEIGADVQRV